MDFAESERVRTIRSIAREFVQKELVPLEPALRRRRFVELLPELRRVRDRAKETGLWAAHLPAEWGGQAESSGSDRSFAATSAPLMPGRVRSRTTTSGKASLAASIAVGPSSAMCAS